MEENYKMKGEDVFVSVFEMPPFTYAKELEADGIRLDGLLYEMWLMIESMINCTSVYSLDSHDFADIAMWNKTRDVRLVPSIADSQNIRYVDFTLPFYSTWYSVFMKKTEEHYTSMSYIKNWTTPLWVAVVLLVITFSMLFYVIEKFRRQPEVDNCLLQTISVLCKQNYLISDSSDYAFRLVLTAALWFSLVISSFYNARILSELTVGVSSLPFQSLEEMSHNNKGYALCVRNYSHPYLYFTDLNDSESITLRPEWVGKLNNKPCQSMRIQPADVFCSDRTVILESPPLVYDVLKNNKRCSVAKLNNKYMNIDLSLILSKHTADPMFLKRINMSFLRMFQGGIIIYLTKKWVVGELITEITQTTTQISFQHINGIMSTYLYITICCFAIFVIEILSQKFKRKKKKKRRYFKMASKSLLIDSMVLV